MLAFSMLGTTVNEHYPDQNGDTYFELSKQHSDSEDPLSHAEITRLFDRPNVPSLHNDSNDIHVFLSSWKQIRRTNRMARKKLPHFEEGVDLPLKVVKPYADRIGSRSVFTDIASMNDFNTDLDEITLQWMQSGKILCANEEEKKEAVRLYEKCACSFMFNGKFSLAYVELCQDLYDRSPTSSEYLRKIGFAYLSTANYYANRLKRVPRGQEENTNDFQTQDSLLQVDALDTDHTISTDDEIAEHNYSEKSLTRAIAYAQKSYDNYKACMQINHHSGVIMEHGACCHLLGNLLSQSGQTDSALQYLDEAFTTYESIIQNNHQAFLEQMLEISLIHIAENKNTAIHIELATDLISCIQEEERFRLMSARLHKTQSDLFFREHDPEFTLHFARLALMEYENLYNSNPERYLYSVCMARLWVMGRLTNSPEDQEKHQRMYETNCMVLQPMMLDNPTVQSILLLAESYLSVASKEIHTYNTCDSALKAIQLIKPRQRFCDHPRYFDIFFKAHVCTAVYDWKNKRYGKAIFKFIRLYCALLLDMYRHIFSDISI